MKDIVSNQTGVRVLILSSGPVKAHMAGPAIRSWELARVLSETCRVTLLTPNEEPLSGDSFLVTSHGGREERAREILLQHDVLLAQGFSLVLMPSLMYQKKCLVIDLYDPFTLENLYTHSWRPMKERIRINNQETDLLNLQLVVGDFFICGSELQRDYWLGMLSANKRLTPQALEEDSSFRKLIDIVTFGLPSTPPQHTRAVLKGVHPKIARTDKLIIWGGGVWDWFDPLTAIQALRNIVARRKDVKLFFLGIQSPDPNVPASKMAEAAISLSKDLGLYNEYVFFNAWAPYADRENYLLEADIAISLHYEHLETRYALRTRIFDYIWARLPMVTSRGDTMSQLIEAAGVGKSVAIEDVDGVTDALLELLSIEDPRAATYERFTSLIESLNWEKVALPLIQYCRNPQRAPDHRNDVVDATAAALTSMALGGTATSATGIEPLPTPLWLLPFKAFSYWRIQGWSGLGREVRNYFNWRKMQTNRHRSK